MFFSHKTSRRLNKKMVKHARPDTHQHIGFVCLRRELKGIISCSNNFLGDFICFFQNDKDTNLVSFFCFISMFLINSMPFREIHYYYNNYCCYYCYYQDDDDEGYYCCTTVPVDFFGGDRFAGGKRDKVFGCFL
jgi:hypothetical protein